MHNSFDCGHDDVRLIELNVMTGVSDHQRNAPCGAGGEPVMACFPFHVAIDAMIDSFKVLARCQNDQGFVAPAALRTRLLHGLRVHGHTLLQP